MADKDIVNILAENIRHYRNRSGWSQIDLADKINISVTFLSSLETGKTWASPATLSKLAAAFGIEVYELLKPETSLSHSSAQLLRKYNEDACRLLGKLQKKYLLTLVKK
ncbi:MAG: helix-turn-helix domain-containing protein [Candidatus Margulisbacteria bacterium]|jgi:transcriptional regulator with XRE-family HTH domain|nr:helix-turn-helix domain-containing protein [Candidatus Margulisiibacteriota bacterium]